MRYWILTAAAILAALTLAHTAAEAHGRALYRVKCAGAWCWITSEPERRQDAKKRRGAGAAHQHRRVAKSSLSNRAHGRDRRHATARAENSILPSPAIAASSAPVSIARRYIGGNPTGWSHVWCGAFMRLVMRSAGLPDLPDGNLARAWSHYGRPSSPRPGAIVVWSHHVGLIAALRSDGRAIVISGNDGHRVRERVRSIASAIAFRGG